VKIFSGWEGDSVLASLLTHNSEEFKLKPSGDQGPFPDLKKLKWKIMENKKWKMKDDQ
jgi:hypothetical protein